MLSIVLTQLATITSSYRMLDIYPKIMSQSMWFVGHD